MTLIDTRPRLDSLTSLRFFAAVLVFFRHVQPFIEQAGVSWTKPILLPGIVGVSFFFILSGFVLMWSRRAGVPTGQFYLRRFARVWPNHAVTWAFVVLVTLLAGGGMNWGFAGLNLGMLHAWSPDPAINNSVNSVSWSLSVEMFFYLSFPLLAPLIDRACRLWFLAGALVGGTFAVVSVSILFVPDGYQVWFVYGFPLTRLLEFAVGMVAARLLLTRKLLCVPLRLALPVVFGAHLTVGFFIFPSKIALTSYAAITVIPFVLLIISAAQSDTLGRWNALRNPWLVRLGDWSFAFYLVHGLVLYYGGKIFLPSDSPLSHIVIFAIGAFIVATATAGLLYHFVERPVERLIRGGLTRRAPQAFVQS